MSQPTQVASIRIRRTKTRQEAQIVPSLVAINPRPRHRHDTCIHSAPATSNAYFCIINWTNSLSGVY